MKEIINRLSAETPKFFKRLRTISVAIAVASTSAAAFYTQLPANFSAFIPEGFIRMIAVAGFVAAFVAQLTKVDSNTPQL